MNSFLAEAIKFLQDPHVATEEVHLTAGVDIRVHEVVHTPEAQVFFHTIIEV